jgi:hypothetical protein
LNAGSPSQHRRLKPQQQLREVPLRGLGLMLRIESAKADFLLLLLRL